MHLAAVVRNQSRRSQRVAFRRRGLPAQFAHGAQTQAKEIRCGRGRLEKELAQLIVACDRIWIADAHAATETIRVVQTNEKLRAF